MKIAIVGAEERKWNGYNIKDVKIQIAEILNKNKDTVLVSGHCPFGGVDIWAEDYTYEHKIKSEIYRPTNNRWTPNGYKERNIRIAESCDEIYVFSPADENGKPLWNGGIWTANYAQALGKKSHFINILKKELKYEEIFGNENKEVKL